MNEEGFISFQCPACATEIEASPDMIGTETLCPACGAKLTVPADGDDGIVRHADSTPEQKAAAKSRTIRIELDDL